MFPSVSNSKFSPWIKILVLLLNKKFFKALANELIHSESCSTRVAKPILIENGNNNNSDNDNNCNSNNNNNNDDD